MVCFRHGAELLPIRRKLLFNKQIDHQNMVSYLPGCPKPGHYGESCASECPNNCQEGHCHITEGTCLGCLTGYIGPTCNTGKEYHFIYNHVSFQPVPLFSIHFCNPYIAVKFCQHGIKHLNNVIRANIILAI